MTLKTNESTLAEIAAKAEQEALKAESSATRLRHLIHLLISSGTVAVMAVLLSTSLMNLVKKIYGNEPVIIHQLSDNSFKQLINNLERASNLIVRLETDLANNPQELAKVISLKTELQHAQTTLKLSTEIKNAQASTFSLDPFSTAYAEDGATTTPTEKNDNLPYVLFGLIALVAFVLIALCLMYIFTSDKVKKAFAEKTITTIMGFIFGLITGQMSGKSN